MTLSPIRGFSRLRTRLRARLRAAEGARGSTFILVLMVLVIVTFLSLSLTLVTEVEMELGGTERIVVKSQHAAESGIHAAISGVLITNNWEGSRLAWRERQVGGQNLGFRTFTTPISAVGAAQPAPMTMANEGQAKYFTFSTLVEVTAQRVAWPDTSDSPYDFADNLLNIQSQENVRVRYVLSPIKEPGSARIVYNDGAGFNIGVRE